MFIIIVIVSNNIDDVIVYSFILGQLTDDVWCLHVISELLFCAVLLKFCKRAIVAGIKNGSEDVQLAEVRAQALVTQCFLLVHYGTLQVSLTCGVEQNGEV